MASLWVCIAEALEEALTMFMRSKRRKIDQQKKEELFAYVLLVLVDNDVIEGHEVALQMQQLTPDDTVIYGDAKVFFLT